MSGPPQQREGESFSLRSEAARRGVSVYRVRKERALRIVGRAICPGCEGLGSVPIQPTAQGVHAPGGGEALPIQGQSEGYPMSTEARRTLVVDLDYLAGLRDSLSFAAEEFPTSAAVSKAQITAIDTIIAEGTTVPLDHLTVVELATPVRETPWQAREREQDRIYSEAQAADELGFNDELGYDPSCTCNYCWASRNADLSPAGGAA